MNPPIMYYTTNVQTITAQHTPSGTVLITNHFVVYVPVNHAVQNIPSNNYALMAAGAKEGFKVILAVALVTAIIVLLWSILRAAK